MKNKIVWTGVVISVLLVNAPIIWAQDNLTLELQTSMVTITEGSVGKDVEGYAQRTNPVILTASRTIQDGLKVRAHVAVPTSFQQIEYHTYRDTGRTIMSIDGQGIGLDYHDWAIGMLWQPVKRLDFLYAVVDYRVTSYKRSTTALTGIIVNDQQVEQTTTVQFGHHTLSFGGGIEKQFAKFGFRAEATIAPLLSSTSYDNTYENTTGLSQVWRSTTSGHGMQLSLTGAYRITDHFGLEGTWNPSSFRSQNQFQKDNDLRPETRWNRYGFGVVTRF